jgi:hypothetical protein
MEMLKVKTHPKGHPNGNHLCVGLGSQVYCKVKIDFIEVRTYYSRAKIKIEILYIIFIYFIIIIILN